MKVKISMINTENTEKLIRTVVFIHDSLDLSIPQNLFYKNLLPTYSIYKQKKMNLLKFYSFKFKRSSFNNTL